MRRSQIAGQVLVYIMGLVIISLVVVFGYKAITNFIHRGDEIALIEFKNKITNTIDEMSSEWGSIKTRLFVLPKGYRKMCFLNSSQYDSTKKICDNGDGDYEPVVCNYWQDANDNAFLIGKKVEAFFIGDDDSNRPYFWIADKPDNVRDGYLCLNATNSRISLKIEGKGKYALLSEG